MPQEVVQEKLARVIRIKIGDVLCYPKFKCIHLTNPVQEQSKKDLHRYRFKEVLIQLFENAQDLMNGYISCYFQKKLKVCV